MNRLRERLHDPLLWQALGRRLWRAGMRLLAGLIGILGAIWARLQLRGRVSLVLATLIVVSVKTASLWPAFSATAHALAVLVLAAVGLRMIVSAPFQRRRR